MTKPIYAIKATREELIQAWTLFRTEDLDRVDDKYWEGRPVQEWSEAMLDWLIYYIGQVRTRA